MFPFGLIFVSVLSVSSRFGSILYHRFILYLFVLPRPHFSVILPGDSRIRLRADRSLPHTPSQSSRQISGTILLYMYFISFRCPHGVEQCFLIPRPFPSLIHLLS